MTKPTIDVLIIDDESERGEIYQDFFGRLSADPRSGYSITPLTPSSPTVALSILESRIPCLVILDVVLTGDWLTNASLIYSRIRSLGYPIVLLSGKFEEPGSDHKAASVLAELKSIPKLGFLPYSSSIRHHCRTLSGARETNNRLPDDTVGMWNFMVAEALGHAVSWTPAHEGEISLMHITDTHFGPAVTPDYMNVVAMQHGTVPQDGRGSVLHADVVLWTGDITDHGYPHEFDLALQFAEDLKKATFITKPCLFSIAPGNHDCCWPLALASRLKTANKAAPMEEKFATGTSDEWEWTLTDTTVNEELWRFSLAPFQQFYSKLIDELSLNKGFNWRPHWKHIGFAILELPIEGYLVPNRKNQSPQPQPFISEQEFKDTTNRALAEVEGSSLEKTVCIFVLIHGRDPDDQQNAQRWNDLLNQLGKKGNPLIVLGGHEHLSDHSYHRNRLTLIGAPFDAIKVESGRTLPSVRFLKLYNLMANNLTCDITRLEKSAGDEKTTNWTQAEVRRYEINTANGHWQDMTKAMLINGRS